MSLCAHRSILTFKCFWIIRFILTLCQPASWFWIYFNWPLHLIVFKFRKYKGKFWLVILIWHLPIEDSSTVRAKSAESDFHSSDKNVIVTILMCCISKYILLHYLNILIIPLLCSTLFCWIEWWLYRNKKEYSWGVAAFRMAQHL